MSNNRMEYESLQKLLANKGTQQHRSKTTKCLLSTSDLWIEDIEAQTILGHEEYYMKLKDGLTAFRDFLKSEFSDENIEFWLACEDFKKAKTSSQLAVKANKIYSEYIKTEAPREVNIDHQTRELISQKISQPTVNCFDDAQQLILCLMSKDSFPRFLRSQHYKDLVKKEPNNGQKRWLPF